MIQANELRIGNWVKSKDYQFKVESIDEDGVNLSCDHGGIYSEGMQREYHFLDFYKNNSCVSGIPLTPEILEKAGFTMNGYGQLGIKLPQTYVTVNRKLYFSSDYLYMEEGDGRSATRDLICLWNKDLMKVFYLHQLQNLYFCLTGTELKIDL